MTEETPAIARNLQERFETVGLLGARCTAFIVRGEDLRKLRRWARIDPGLARTEYQGIPVHGIDVDQGIEVAGVWVVRSEDLQRMTEAMPEESPMQLAAVEPGECWACAVEGVMPRSD